MLHLVYVFGQDCGCNKSRVTLSSGERALKKTLEVRQNDETNHPQGEVETAIGRNNGLLLFDAPKSSATRKKVRIIRKTISPHPPLPLLNSLHEPLRESGTHSKSLMAKTLVSSTPFVGTSLPSISRRGAYTLPYRSGNGLVSTRIRFSLHHVVPPINPFDSGADVASLLSRAEGLLYTLADAAVAVDPAASGSADAAAQKNGGWFGFISEAMEFVLKILKDGLATVHVPYAYGFAIILLTVLVKLATLPLTKQQVESTLAMQNLQPKLKAIQERYKGNQERIQLETSRLYRQAGVNPLAGCLPTLATIPVWIGLYQALSNVANEGLLTEGFFWIPLWVGQQQLLLDKDGQPPLGWHDTAAYLVLPVLLVASQYVSMEIMKPPQTDDPAQKNTLLVFKFLPLMIGYFSLSVPSGLSIYWLTNNVLSTAQQVWLRRLGGAKPVVSENASGIITAGRAKRSDSQPVEAGSRKLREEEKKNKLSKALSNEEVQTLASTSDSEAGSDEETKDKGEEILEAYASTVGKELPDDPRPRRSKRSKRKRAGSGCIETLRAFYGTLSRSLAREEAPERKKRPPSFLNHDGCRAPGGRGHHDPKHITYNSN
ncbi:63 kDa inner membrane family protein [Prunus dulcis]|uniref:63 kDa inner membrane family protein n=1 Tax=Prunus dulcis TaxID=3755 RepID=A0A4Y1RKD8_PRUDU|nr:63 kDa inner membrane family protein [Prunus dulcis]